MYDCELFQWSDDYLTGNDVIDKEHQYLFSLLQKVFDVISQFGGDQQIIMDSLDTLLDFTESHFRDEELMMRYYHYTDYENHREKHDLMISQVEEMQKQISETDPIRTTEILRFLKIWMINHILKEDTKLVQLAANADTNQQSSG